MPAQPSQQAPHGSCKVACQSESNCTSAHWSAHMHDAQLAMRISRVVDMRSLTSAYNVLLFAWACSPG